MRGHKVENGAISILTTAGATVTWSRGDLDARGLPAVTAEICAAADRVEGEVLVDLDQGGDFLNVTFGAVGG